MAKDIDTFDTFRSLNWILRILCLSNVTRKKNHLILSQFQFRNTMTFASLSIINLIFLVFKIKNCTKSITAREDHFFVFGDTIQLFFIFGYIEYAIDFFLAYKSRYEMLNYLIFYDNVDAILGKPDLTRLESNIKKNVSFFITSFILTTVGDLFSWYTEYGWLSPVLYTLEYVYFFTNTMTVLDVISHLMHIEFRMKSLVKYLEDYYALTLSAHDGGNRDTPKTSRLVTFSSVKFGVLFLNRSYLILIEQVARINNAFGVRLLAYYINLLINLIYHVNIFLRLGQGQFEDVLQTNCLPLISTFVRVMMFIAVVSALVYRCEQTYKQGDYAVRLIDLILVNENVCAEMRNAFTELRVLIISRPIKFHAASFFTCDYPLLVTISSAVGTYTVILYQSMK